MFFLHAIHNVLNDVVNIVTVESRVVFSSPVVTSFIMINVSTLHSALFAVSVSDGRVFVITLHAS